MLAYLDALIAAIAAIAAGNPAGNPAENPAEIARLLAHPLARTLTRDARVEAEQVAAGVIVSAPLRLLQLRHQTAQLLGDHADAAEREVESTVVPPSANRPAPRAPARHQMELPLSA